MEETEGGVPAGDGEDRVSGRQVDTVREFGLRQRDWTLAAGSEWDDQRNGDAKLSIHEAAHDLPGEPPPHTLTVFLTDHSLHAAFYDPKFRTWLGADTKRPPTMDELRDYWGVFWVAGCGYIGVELNENVAVVTKWNAPPAVPAPRVTINNCRALRHA